jgi:hypothetical protein
MAVLADIETPDLVVDPGGRVATQVKIRNQGTRVDEFRLSILGDASPWATVDPVSVHLFPKGEASVTVTFAPPRASKPAAAAYPFGVLIQSIAEPDDSRAEEGTITVGPFVTLAAEVRPRTSRGRRAGGHLVTVRNDGNAAGRVTARAVDPDEAIALTLQPPAAELEPAATAEHRVTARAGNWFLFGASRRYPFSIEVSETQAGTQSIPAVFEQRALLPGWLLAAAGVVLAAVVLVLGSGILKPPAGTESPGPGQATNAVAGQPTAAPTEAGGGEPTTAPGGGSTTPPEVTPEPTRGIYLTITGGSPVDGDYNAIHQQALRHDGEIDIFLRYLINGGFCYVELITGDTSVPATYTYPDMARAHFSCDAGSPGYTAVTGELVLDQFDAIVSGSFDFFADTAPNVNLYGIFRDIVVE